MSANEVVAVAWVADSSLVLLAEWQRVLHEYLSPLVQRLHEVYAGRQIRMGFICYAPASTRPTPILSRTFFCSPQQIVKELREEPNKYGIGQTGAGGGRGMSALEGLVATVEMFDILKESVQSAICHVIHIAASVPDSAERPLWNHSPRLDSTSWETLPLELRKREISYSNILLQRNPRLAQFHAAVSAGLTQTPWFAVRTPHAIHLHGYPPPKGTKRVNEGPGTSAERSPESKRQRVSSTTQKSPKTPNVVSQSASTSVISNATVQTIPQSTSTPAALAPSQPTGTQPQARYPSHLIPIIERFRLNEAKLQQLMKQKQQAESAGKTQEAAALNAEIQKALPNHAKFKAVVQAELAKVQFHKTGAPSSAPPPTSTSAPELVASSLPPTAGALPSQTTQTVRHEPQPPSLPPTASVHEPQLPSLPPQTLPQSHSMPLPTPQIAAQMQKLVEQRNRTPHMSHSNIPTSSSSEQKPAVQAGGASGQQPSWKGTLTWTGFDSGTHLRKDIKSQVLMNVTQHGELMRPETWPLTLALTPSKDRALPPYILQEWIRRHKAVLFILIPQPIDMDPKINEDAFRVLVRLLAERNIYALSGWNNPEGKHENKLLIFHLKHGTTGLVGVYFPQPGGVPELPKHEICGLDLSVVPQAVALMLYKMTPEQQNALSRLSPDKRLEAVQAIFFRQQKQSLPQQQQPQMPMHVNDTSGGRGGNGMPANSFQQPAMPSMTMPNNFGNAIPNQGSPVMQNVNSGMSLNVAQMQRALAMGVHQRTSSGSSTGGGIGGVPMEMMQSFLQRSQDSSGGPNAGHG